ncbi:MAG: anthranilate phosphoribosyltransferase [Candidatus Sumerlaeia bacterium]|nr:anthranilate phosphoribosyltransferase [Candidatus Sumerlaeia bacterium]
MHLQDALQTLAEGQHLTAEEAEQVAGQLISGAASPAQTAALLMALRVRGEAPAELTGFVRAIRSAAAPFPRPEPPGGVLLDTCGTGGDGIGTFNVSTAVAVIAASLGVPVAKHGNRAASSRSGSADVLEQMGYPLDLEPEASARLLEEEGFCFLMAPSYHPALRHVGPVRRELKVRTIFNLCGPLANPARPTHQIVGVSDARFLIPMAETLVHIGIAEALLVCGSDTLDELTLSGPTEGIRVRDGRLLPWRFQPEELDWPRRPLDGCLARDAAHSAELLAEVFEGKAGPATDLALLNCGAALMVAGRAASVGKGVELAREAVESGEAPRKWERIVARAGALR